MRSWSRFAGARLHRLPQNSCGVGFEGARLQRLLKNSCGLGFERARLSAVPYKSFILSFRGASAPRNLLFLPVAKTFSAASLAAEVPRLKGRENTRILATSRHVPPGLKAVL